MSSQAPETDELQRGTLLLILHTPTGDEGHNSAGGPPPPPGEPPAHPRRPGRWGDGEGPSKLTRALVLVAAMILCFLFNVAVNTAVLERVRRWMP